MLPRATARLIRSALIGSDAYSRDRDIFHVQPAGRGLQRNLLHFRRNVVEHKNVSRALAVGNVHCLALISVHVYKKSARTLMAIAAVVDDERILPQHAALHLGLGLALIAEICVAKNLGPLSCAAVHRKYRVGELSYSQRPVWKAASRSACSLRSCSSGWRRWNRCPASCGVRCRGNQCVCSISSCGSATCFATSTTGTGSPLARSTGHYAARSENARQYPRS